MTITFESLQLQQTASRSVQGLQTKNNWQQRSKVFSCAYGRDSTNSVTLNPSLSFQKKLGFQIVTLHNNYQCHWGHHPSLRADASTTTQKTISHKRQLWKFNSIYNGSRHGNFLSTNPFVLAKTLREQVCEAVTTGGSNENFDGEVKGNLEEKYCSKRYTTPLQGTPNKPVETLDESGYVIKVSKDLMGVFQYVEKVKRARLRELSDTLRQVALACFFFSCVKGVVTPLVEVFKTQPPSWGKLIMVVGAFDAFAITYLAMKASEPLERLLSLATECESETDMMGSIEKEEEHMLALAVDLVRLFRRLRNLALCTAVTQFAHILHAILQLKKSYPNFAINIIKFVKSWLSTPWV